MKEKRTDNKGIFIRVDDDFHRELKVRAGLRNFTIKQYVKAALTSCLEQERKFLPLKTER